MKDFPIFICGTSRSGTNLTHAALNNHSLIEIAGETHYFDDLYDKYHKASQLTQIEQTYCEDYFLALFHRPYGHQGNPEMSSIKREIFKEKVKTLGGKLNAYFEAFCLLYIKKETAQYWGEKTPRHIYRIADIIENYSNAKIICMIRDPRAYVASYRDWKNQGGFDLEADPGHGDAIKQDEQRSGKSYHPIIMSMLWQKASQAAQNAMKKYGNKNIYLQSYEELVLSPRESLENLCNWLEIPFEESMLEVPIHNSSFSQFEKQGGFNSSAIQRWKEKLSKAEIAIIQSICKKDMAFYQYDNEKVGFQGFALLKAWLTFPFAALQALMANRSRMGNVLTYIKKRLFS